MASGRRRGNSHQRARQQVAPAEAKRRAPQRAETRAPAPADDKKAELDPLGRRDLWIALAVAAVAAAIFVTTFSGHVALGDAPESVAGIKSFGVLHSPGYPAYVLIAHAFGTLVPVGSWATRVNLFSVVCSSLMVAAVFLLARCFRATRVGAAIGALAVGTSASMWFNAGFAKHYSFTGMLVALGALGVMLFTLRNRPGYLVGAAIALGMCLGSGWEAALIVVVASVALFIVGTRRPSRLLAVGSVLVMAATAIAAYGFLVVRAGQHPAVNWGDATSPSRLFALLTDSDFRKAGVASTNGNLAVRVGIRIPSYAGIIVRDLGLAAALVALAGIVVAWKRFPREWKLFLGVMGGLNLVAVVFTIGFIDHIMGFRTSVIAGGYLLDLMIVLAVLVSIAFTPLALSASDLLAQSTTPDRYQSQTATKARGYYPIVASILGALILVPSLVFHYQPATHRIPALADSYGSRVLAGLPRNSVLFVLPADWAFPITYRQVVDAQRRDVSVVVIDNFGLSWYLSQIERDLHVRTPRTGEPLDRAVALLGELEKTRPVYLDMSATQLLQERVGYRVRGLVSEVVPGKPSGPRAIPDLPGAAAELSANDRADGVTGHEHLRFPNDPVLFLRARAHIELAKAHLLLHDTPGALTELQRAVDIYPDDHQTARILLFMQQRGTGAEDVIRHM